MLEAKIYLGNGLVCSMATEFIENSGEYNEKKLSEGESKQDCESKAFVRLSEKIKKRFPRLPICIVADGLYVSERALQICEDNNWEYIIRYKKGCAPTIEEEYQSTFKAVHSATITNQSSAVTGSQTAVSYFPEFYYWSYWRLLERMSSGMEAQYQFKSNEDSTYGRRTHFPQSGYRTEATPCTPMSWTAGRRMAGWYRRFEFAMPFSCCHTRLHYNEGKKGVKKLRQRVI